MSRVEKERERRDASVCPLRRARAQRRMIKTYGLDDGCVVWRGKEGEESERDGGKGEGRDFSNRSSAQAGIGRFLSTESANPWLQCAVCCGEKENIGREREERQRGRRERKREKRAVEGFAHMCSLSLSLPLFFSAPSPSALLRIRSASTSLAAEVSRQRPSLGAAFASALSLCLTTV